MKNVIASLTRINTLRFYSHIKKIDSLPRGRWIFIFSQPDRWFAVAAGRDAAMILPREWKRWLASPAYRHRRPYAVRRNTPNQLKILAFDDCTSATGR